MPLTASQVEENKEKASVGKPTKLPKAKPGTHPNSLKNLCAPWKPGDIPNPTGKNGRDVARDIAQAVFSNNEELIYKAFVKALGKGNAYAFDVIASRGFGKLKEKLEVSGLEALSERLNDIRKRKHGSGSK